MVAEKAMFEEKKVEGSGIYEQKKLEELTPAVGTSMGFYLVETVTITGDDGPFMVCNGLKVDLASKDVDALVASAEPVSFIPKSILQGDIEDGNWHINQLARLENTIRKGDEYKGKNIDLRKQFEIPEDDIILGYFGVINFNVRPINKIIKKIQESKNIHFFIGGVGADEDKIEDYIKNMKNVYYLGWLENVREYVNSLDYVVYVMNNSRKYSSYTAPNTLYLAISHQKPIITNVNGEPLEVIEEHNVGHFIKDIDNFSLETLVNKNEYSSIVNNIGKIKDNYLWSNSVKVYSEILSK